MKLFKLLLSFVILMAYMEACQKELNFDGDSVGSFHKDVSGNCLPITSIGTFQVDSTIAQNTNYVDVEVIVSIGGPFDIRSDTMNGYSFSKQGNVGKGVNTIRLYATGKPIAAGVNMFTIKYGNSTCSFNITVSGPGAASAVYTLAGAPSTCSGAIVNGTLTQGIALGAGNTVTIQVNVTTPGNYTIGAASVNGILYTGTGIFAATGIQPVTLTGAGLPLAAGTFNVTASNGTSSCTFSVIVLPAGSSGAVFTLNGAPGLCSGAVVNGTYTAGTALTAVNTISLNVTVSTIGTYTITTNTVNGISFTKSGTFSSTGSQPVVLNGTGTPTAPGTFNFTATAGASACTFSIICVSTPNQDFFPLTPNSWWTYNSDHTAPDTLFKVNASQSSLAGNTYRRFDYGAGPTGVSVYDSTYYRKSGSDYYHYINIDTFSSFFFDVTQHGEILFLKENAPLATTWQSIVYSGTVGGLSTLLQYSFTIAAVNSIVIVNGVTYNNVTQVNWKSMENKNGAGYVDQVLYQSYYAKGIGLIKYVQDDISIPGIQDTDNIRNYLVY